MQRRNFISILSICTFAVFILGFQLKPDFFDIPKTWDLAEIKQFLLPTADSTIAVTPISESYYYSIPEMKVYKSYPIRLTGLEENRKYIDSLKALNPVDHFQNEPRTEEDLVRLGEEVFNAPIGLFDYSEEFFKELNESIKSAEIPVSKNTFPYYTYVVDEKSKVKVGVFSCAMCHTRVMPDGLNDQGGTRDIPDGP